MCYAQVVQVADEELKRPSYLKKRPTDMLKRALHIWKQRPTDMLKEPYTSGKRDLRGAGMGPPALILVHTRSPSSYSEEGAVPSSVSSGRT
jgi:hypothetical protein